MSEVMIRFKKTYYSVETLDDDTISIKFSNKGGKSYNSDIFKNKDGTSADYLYIGAFNASEDDDGKLRSIAGQTPVNADLDLLRSKLKEGYNVLSYDEYMYIYSLLLLVTKSFDINDTIGSGSNEVFDSGTMDNKGMFFGSDKYHDGNKVFGLENLWGFKPNILEGIYQKNNEIYKAVDKNYADTDSYKKVDIAPNLNKGYISKLHADLDFFTPMETKGSSSTFTTAYSNFGRSDSVNPISNILMGGSANKGIANMLNIKSGHETGLTRITSTNIAKED